MKLNKKKMPSEFVNCVITSPPYWALRDYGVAGQLGLEPTFEEYVTKLCDIFDEVKRVLKKTGTVWVNIGDTYSQSGGAGNQYSYGKNRVDGFKKYGGHKVKNLKPKSLVGVPFRFALEMINRGWILRNTIIWHKPNCMPSSAKDRFTVDFEYVFFFVKSKKYYFEQQFDNYAETTIPRMMRGVNENKYTNGFGNQTAQSINKPRPNLYKIYKYRGVGTKNYEAFGVQNPSDVKRRVLESIKFGKGRNRRCVWKITTKAFKGAHFATFPEELISPMIKAGCPEHVCKNCGMPRQRKYIKKRLTRKRLTPQTQPTADRSPSPNDYGDMLLTPAGYSSCNCNKEFVPGIVLDPFIGSGTTAVVAKKLGRKYIGIELNPKYVVLAEARIRGADAVALKSVVDKQQSKLVTGIVGGNEFAETK